MLRLRFSATGRHHPAARRQAASGVHPERFSSRQFRVGGLRDKVIIITEKQPVATNFLPAGTE
jgi:hypothetical protein